MNIDVNGLNSNRPDSLKRNDSSRPNGNASEAEQSVNTRSDAGDSVSLSSAASALSSLESQIKELPDVDQNRVDQIKARISNGSYEINSQNLAQRMLDSEL